MRNALDRRQFLALAAAGLAFSQEPVTYPMVSEEACPLTPVAPLAKDGYQGLGVARRPPGTGPFPAVLWIHGGLAAQPARALQATARAPNPSRMLATGYVVIVPTYRSRDVDPQTTVSLADCLAVVEYTRGLSYVDPKSLVVYGCSGGGDLALEVAAATDVCAIVAEEPASLLMAGMLNVHSSKRGPRYSPADAGPIMDNPKEHYTPEHRRILRAKIERIHRPILLLQGDPNRAAPQINQFNAHVLIPELRAADKTLAVITYPGEPHCFCFSGTGPQTPRPAAALKASRDIVAFCGRHVATQPKALDPSLSKQITLGS